ncbi:MAG: hypothetical protein V4613_14840 [Bacteroidota bacterium]
MKSKSAKLLILFTFVALFIGSALFMYFKYVHNRPKIKVVAPRTEIDQMKLDSAIRSQKGYKR